MRIIAGKYRGTRLVEFEGGTVRPTSDRVRETLFNMLVRGRIHKKFLEHTGQTLFPGAQVLDAFAGTGSFGIEALSQGADFVTFMEKNREALFVLRRNLARIPDEEEAHDKTRVIAANILSPPKSEKPVNLVFLDPPYGADLTEKAMESLEKQGWIGPHTLIIIEMDKRDAFDLPPPYALWDERTFSHTRVLVVSAKS